MTKKEAIERLKQNKAAAEFYAQMIGNYRSAENELKDIVAFNMAIEALQWQDRILTQAEDILLHGERKE